MKVRHRANFNIILEVFVRANGVYVGMILPHICKQFPVGGSSVNKLLQDQLEKECPELLAHINLESFKKQYCHVRSSRTAKSDTKRQVSVKGKTYSLNGNVLTDPCEALFHPSLFQTVHDSLAEQINDVARAIIAEDKKLAGMAKKVILSGGPTLHEGFVTRLENELKEVCPERAYDVIAVAARDTASWLGGSILGSLSTFPSMWITKRIYDESGTCQNVIFSSTDLCTDNNIYRPIDRSLQVLLKPSLAIDYLQDDYMTSTFLNSWQRLFRRRRGGCVLRSVFGS